MDISRQGVAPMDGRQRRLDVGFPSLDVEPNDRTGVVAEAGSLQGEAGHEENVHTSCCRAHPVLLVVPLIGHTEAEPPIGERGR